jgi:hypothetical protein
VATLKLLAGRLGAGIEGYVVGGGAESYETHLHAIQPHTPLSLSDAGSWAEVRQALRKVVQRDDLVVLLGAREGTVAWDPPLAGVPRALAEIGSANFIVLYPSEGPAQDEALIAEVGAIAAGRSGGAVAPELEVASAAPRARAWTPRIAALAAGVLLWLAAVFIFQPGRLISETKTSLRLRSRLPAAALVDVRFWGGGEGLDGTVARMLAPDREVVLYLPRGRDACVRVIDPETAAVVGVRVGASEETATLTLTPELAGQSAQAERCEPGLERDRIRIAPGRYIEPYRPTPVRRERILRGPR